MQIHTYTHDNFALCQFLFLGNENASRQTSKLYRLVFASGNLKNISTCVCAQIYTQFALCFVYIDIVMQYADRKFAFNGYDRRTVEFSSFSMLAHILGLLYVYMPQRSPPFLCDWEVNFDIH